MPDLSVLIPARNEKQIAARKKWRVANPDKEKEAQRRYQSLHPERVKETRRKYRERNHEQLLAKSRLVYANNIEKARRISREWYANNKERVRENIRQKKYGVSKSEIAMLLERQEHRCASCGSTPLAAGGARSPQTLDIDHDHVTGRVRGLLCRGCNLALGYVKESSERLRFLAEYIERVR